MPSLRFLPAPPWLFAGSHSSYVLAALKSNFNSHIPSLRPYEMGGMMVLTDKITANCMGFRAIQAAWILSPCMSLL
jgi:hypothetical protein